MKGVVPIGHSRVDVRSIEMPEPEAGEVVVQLKCAGICGSDLHAFRRTWEEIGERQNLVIGHEAAGIVAEVGSGGDSSMIGRRVSVYHYRGCGICEHCRVGDYMLCAKKKGYGWHMHGADADYVLTDERNCCLLPESLSFEDGAFMACAAGTGYSALAKFDQVRRKAGYTAVLGLGPVGLTAAIMAQAKGISVIGLDPSEDKRGFAEKQGVQTLDLNRDMDAATQLKEAMDGELPIDVFDASGSEAALTTAFSIVGVHGSIVTVGKGMWPLHFSREIDIADFIRKQALLMGSYVLPLHQYKEMMTLMVERGVSFSKLVTARFPIDRAQEAFEKAAAHDAVGKVVITWEDNVET